MLSVRTGTTSPTFRYTMGDTPCEFAELYCTGNRYWGRPDWTCDDDHVAGWSCNADHECENGMVILPDWGGPCPPRKADTQSVSQEES